MPALSLLRTPESDVSCIDTALTSKLISGIQTGSPYPCTLSCSYSKPERFAKVWFTLALWYGPERKFKETGVRLFVLSFWVRVSLCPTEGEAEERKRQGDSPGIMLPQRSVSVGFCVWDCMHQLWLDSNTTASVCTRVFSWRCEGAHLHHAGASGYPGEG